MAKPEQPAKLGRPTVYRPEYCERVIEMGREGASAIEMATDLGVSRNTMARNWTALHPEFADALEMALQHSQTWWEKRGREGMTKRDFNAQVWSRSMSARFPSDWRETHRNELTGADGKPIATTAEPDMSGLTEEQVRMVAMIRLKGDGDSSALN